MDFLLKALNNTEVNNNALNGSTLPSTIKILNWGKSDTTSGPVWLDERSVELFDAWQKRTGREDVALDFEHNTVPQSETYEKGKAVDIAAYGNPKIIPGDGLYLTNLEWTPIGEAKAKNYKDLSPAAITTEDGVVVGLHSAALTTNGAVYKLNFYTAKGIEDMIKILSVKDYNKDDANAGVKQEGDKYVPNTNPMSADDVVEEGHKEDCMCASCMSPDHMGADDNWMESEHKAHKELTKDLAADDHYSKYGDVKYADETNHRYPIDTEKHIRAAWSYVNMPKNARKLGGKLSEVKSKISAAMKKIGAKIETKNAEESTTTMSANKAQPYNKNMIEDKTKLTVLAATSYDAPTTEEDKEGKSDEERILFALLGKFIGEHPELMEQITKKSISADGALVQWSSKAVEGIKQDFETYKAEQATKQADAERDVIVSQAIKEGKVIALSANAMKKLDISELKEYVAKLDQVVPMKSKMKTLSASTDTGLKPSREKAIAKFNEMLNK